MASIEMKQNDYNFKEMFINDIADKLGFSLIYSIGIGTIWLYKTFIF